MSIPYSYKHFASALFLAKASTLSVYACPIVLNKICTESFPINSSHAYTKSGVFEFTFGEDAMRKIRNPDFFYTYQPILPFIYRLSPRTHQVITANPSIFTTPGKDAELLSPLVWLYEENTAEITSDVKQIIEFDLIFSTLLTYALESDPLAKAIFNIASTLRSSDALTMRHLQHIIQFPSINNPKYYPENDDEHTIENFNAPVFMNDLLNYFSKKGYSQLINSAHSLSFVYQHDLINHHNFACMTAFIAENNATLNDINQLLEDTIGGSEADYLNTLFKIDFIKTSELQLIAKILYTLKDYGELSAGKIDFLFSTIQEKINLNQPQEIKPFLENTLTNILNLTFFGINTGARLQLISNLDALDDLFYTGLSLSELVLFDAEMRKMLLDNISEDNIQIIRFFINRQEISPFLFFSSYVNKEILKQLSQITIELEILGEFDNDRLEQVFKDMFDDNAAPSDIKKVFSDLLSTQFDSIITYDFFDLPAFITSQLVTNNNSMELIWRTGISLIKFTSLDNELRKNAIQGITEKNAAIVKFFSGNGVPTELFFGPQTLSIIDDIAIILAQDNAHGISSEQLEDLYFSFQEYFLALRIRMTTERVADFFQMHLEILENSEDATPATTPLSENRAGFFSTTRSSRQNNSDENQPSSSPP